jgi:broad specificity phosphatase PhoE
MPCDPAAFALGDCSTQRNLSAAGRLQARRIGALFRAHGIDDAIVFSSQWWPESASLRAS